ncbi:MAG: GNAT family N-acetyltransferase [Flavobacteriales bacterium CG_4_10_14_0_2_um_filter_32_8]|nr:MAG: GNAT family N-acetyltransferase [Flavobacteriales bacterium CG_4_10_14_0_2_um_filter_32_8]PJB15798.1 MAG: GNAT family N-acetyltransferase [Flavobacteriales bacterium CG_4_9_14_3_um_filter_32_8]
MSIEFKPITKNNIFAALEIYNWYVMNSTATFNLKEVKEEEFERMISLGHSKYQSFVILSDDEICGFCYIGQFRKKEAYDKSVEVTLYLNQGFTGKGIGKKAITFIENIAQQNDIKNLVAVITEGNLASITLFEKMGYFKVGHLKNIGEKFGKSLDVVSYQKEI